MPFPFPPGGKKGDGGRSHNIVLTDLNFLPHRLHFTLLYHQSLPQTLPPDQRSRRQLAGVRVIFFRLLNERRNKTPEKIAMRNEHKYIIRI